MQANPAKVTIGSRDLAASHSITQKVLVLEQHDRDAKLLELLAQHHKSRKNRVIIFVLYKKEAPRVESMLQRKGWTVSRARGRAFRERGGRRRKERGQRAA